MLFDKYWFLKHQRILRWFANTWIGRKIFCIDGDKSSIGKNKIIKIEPNAIFWKGKGKKVIGEFRTHNKFAKRIYYTFLPVWYLFHAWDILFANNFAPNLNLGFDTTPDLFPDVGTGSTTCDSYVAEAQAAGVIWGTLRGGAGTNAGASDNPTSAVDIVADDETDKFRTLQRFIATWDTSSIGLGATVASATLSLRGASVSDSFSPAIAPNINVYAAAPATNNSIVAGDFDSVGTSAYSTAISYASFSTSGYNDFALNASGLVDINVSGISRFGAANPNYDVANVSPTWSAFPAEASLNINTADAAGTTTDPKLVVTYTPGAGVANRGYAFII